MIADTAVVLSNILFAFICFGTVFIPQRMPELWGGLRLPLQQEQALPEVHSGRRVLRGHGAGALLQMSQLQAIILVIITVIAILFAQLRYRSGAVKPVKSYEKL